MRRLDQWLVEEGCYPSREKARLAILAGEVEIEGRGGGLKAGTALRPDDRVIIRKRGRFVSRGGDKLDGVLERWGIDISGCDALDVGASTGGFTHCLLQRDAARVIALDVGRGQLHWDLRTDPRVTVMEGVNVRYLEPRQLPFAPEIATVDVSFISLRLVLPALGGVLGEGANLFALIKPQFEAGRGKVGKKGIVRDPQTHREVLEAVLSAASGAGFVLFGLAPSPLRGAGGNTEYFAWWRRGTGGGEKDMGRSIEGAVREAWQGI